MATMKDVADRAGVSTATVSHVINGTKKLSPATTERVLTAIREIGYNPNTLAKSLRSGQTRLIGVLVEDIRGMPVPDIVAGIGDVLNKAGYRMLLADLHLLEQLYNRYEQIGVYRTRINDAVSLLLSSRVEGIIYVGMHDRHLDFLFDPADKPLVFAYSHGTARDTFVTYANLDSAAEMTTHLIRMGHTRIAVIAGHPHSYPTMKRLNGFQLAFQRAGLSIPDGYILYGDWEYRSGYEKAKEFLSLNPRPTAIFAMNDLMAAGAMHAITEAGLRIPEDISVVGFDNREISKVLQPALTTVAIPTRQIGVRAAMCLLEHIQNPNAVPGREILPCEIIERDSAAAPKEV